MEIKERNDKDDIGYLYRVDIGCFDEYELSFIKQSSGYKKERIDLIFYDKHEIKKVIDILQRNLDKIEENNWS
jgi:hypothetical protein